MENELMERLDKFLANAGIGTRSEVKKYMKSGRILINDKICKAPDTKIDPDTDQIVFDGKPVLYERFEYILLNKPKNCVTATEDKHDATVMDYIQSDRKNRLFPVGRLDKDTEGLLLITDDGELSHRLLAPKKHVNKTYVAEVTGHITEEKRLEFEKGLDIGDEKLTLPASLKILSETDDITKTEVTISEGRFHQIKRMFLAIGNEVIYLKRISMGPLELSQDLDCGMSRRLTQEEINSLKELQ